jgi:membrane-bound metal-dependent hydrolase YbcI (DUF457 family)
MASFRTHFAWGIVLGVAGVAATAALVLADQSSFLAALFLAVVAGAILPDMDSDSGVPFHVTFGALSLMAGAMASSHAFRTDPDAYLRMAEYAAGAVFLVWVVAGSVFKRFTHHRGMAHSIPAALLAGVATFLLTGKYGFGQWEAFLLAVAVSVGYVGHLVLDEAYSAVNFHGLPFVPKQSLGSALKFFSRDISANVLVYGLLGALLAGHWTELSSLSDTLVSAIGKAM